MGSWADENQIEDSRLYELHMYKELMSAEERGGRYRLLRLSGATPGQAQRWRDWSPPHFSLILDYICGQSMARP